MGAMYRDNGQLRAAEGFLRQALRCAESLGDDVVRASCLTHLGTVLIASDAGAAIKHLEEACQLREDQVGRAHRQGGQGAEDGVKEGARAGEGTDGGNRGREEETRGAGDTKGHGGREPRRAEEGNQPASQHEAGAGER